MTESKAARGRSRVAILVADDTAYVRIMLCKMLEPMGFDILEAKSGAEAEQILGENKNISLLLRDIQMPGQDGLETLKNLYDKLRARVMATLDSGQTEPHRLAEKRDNTNDLRSMALIAYTSDLEPGAEQEPISPLKAGGVDECFPFPFGLDDLVTTVESVLGLRSNQDEMEKSS